MQKNLELNQSENKAMKLQMALDCKNFVQKEQDFQERETYLND